MSFNKIEVSRKISLMIDAKLFAIVDNIYKETLREIKSIFSSLYYVDGNGDKINVRCAMGATDRAAGKTYQDNTFSLPYITVVEKGSSNDDSKRRYSTILVSEKIWDAKENKAKRYVSVPSRPIIIEYDINVWTKYLSEMDQLRYSIFSLFNPSLAIPTKFSTITKAFIKNEGITNYTAQDGNDRLVQKSISISVETYMPSPKFLYTNTGSIESVNIDPALL